MTKKTSIYNGKEKKVFLTEEDSSKVIIHFKDTVTAFNNIKQARNKGKGDVCCKISSLLFKELNKAGIPTHFIEQVADDDQLCHKISLIPIQFTVHNYTSGLMADRLGLEEGMPLTPVVINTNYNCDDLNDPLIYWDEIIAMGILDKDSLMLMKSIAIQTNGILTDIFAKAGIKLVDLRMEFGRDVNGNIIISDEISPDTCRLVDIETDRHLDKDLFRRDLGDIIPAYKEVLRRLLTAIE